MQKPPLCLCINLTGSSVRSTGKGGAKLFFMYPTMLFFCETCKKTQRGTLLQNDFFNKIQTRVIACNTCHEITTQDISSAPYVEKKKPNKREDL